MTAIEIALAREAVGIAEAVLEGADMTEGEARAAVILFRAVLRYAADEGTDISDVPAVGRVVDALAYLTGTFREPAAGGVS